MTAVVAHVVAVSAGRWRSIDRDSRYRPFSTGRSLVDSTDTCAGLGFRDRFWVFSAYKKLLGRTETRTRERMYCQAIQTVRDISRDDRARIATCSLLIFLGMYVKC